MTPLPFTRPDIDEATIAAVGDVLRSGWITTGPKCRELEAALSTRFGGRPVRVCTSATAALHMALTIAGVGQGDEVITTPLSWIATASVILALGAKPVFVDVDPLTRNIDLDRIEAALSRRTRAIIPVDLAGLPVDREALYEIAQRHGLRVIEDAAQSIGARSGGREIGTIGDLVAFSFHPNKNITSIEGGCLVMNDEDEARQFEKLRLQGVQRLPDGTMDVDLVGGKSNLTDVAAVVALGQLPRLAGFNARREFLAKRYFDLLDPDWGLELPRPAFGESNWHMFQPLLNPDKSGLERSDVIRGMAALGIAVGIHYPTMHLFSLFRAMGYKDGDFPVAERVGRATMTLPLFPAMADDDVDRVVDGLRSILDARKIS